MDLNTVVHEIAKQVFQEELSKLANEMQTRGVDLPSRDPLRLGNKVFVRTVTFHYTGRVVEVTDKAVVLEHAAWIADDGRFADAIAKGTLKEVEPYPDDVPVVVNRDAIVDACTWKHDLPREQR